MPPIVLTSIGVNSDVQEEEEIVFRTPYYLENFRTIINTILSCEDDSKLFNDDDRKFISVFEELTGKNLEESI
jgi:hypothetical protein